MWLVNCILKDKKMRVVGRGQQHPVSLAVIDVAIKYSWKEPLVCG